MDYRIVKENASLYTRQRKTLFGWDTEGKHSTLEEASAALDAIQTKTTADAAKGAPPVGPEVVLERTIS